MKTLRQNQFLKSAQESEWSIRQHRRLSAYARQWDWPIRNVLKQLGRSKWPEKRRLGLLPDPMTRVRSELTPEKAVWWVEHDIPPYDRFRCAAYSVELEMDGEGQPRVVVRSGGGSYPLDELGIHALRTVLVRAAQDLPAIIPRRMGPAFD
ncbi:MAG: hypothetical protein PHS96_05980 [Anaerolineales bacterium]|nr:hypothetical protein [Anaerolineales bacterium]